MPPPRAVAVGVPSTVTICLPEPSATELGVPPRVVRMREPREVGGVVPVNALTVPGLVSSLGANVLVMTSAKTGVPADEGPDTGGRAMIG